MPFLLATLGLLACCSLLAYRYVVFPALISDLRRLPNCHWSSPFTSLWVERRWFRNVDNNRRITRLLRAHQVAGPVVRVGPTDVSISSPEGLRQVYIFDLWKDDWYPTNDELGDHMGHLPMIRIRDREAHSQRKRLVAGAYSKSFVLSSPDLEVSVRLYMQERLVPHLQKAKEESKPVNVLQFAQWSSADLISAYQLGSGNRTDFLDNPTERESYLGRELDWTQNKAAGARFFLNKCRTAVDQSNLEPDGATKPVVLSRLYEGMRGPKSALPEDELMKACASELLDQFLAGHELMSIMLTYAFWELSKRPQLQSRLRAELSTLSARLFEPAAKPSSRSPTLVELDALPLTHAVLYETLRLYHPTPGEQPRIVKQGGIRIHGYFIPPQTRISANIYTQHHNEEVYPDSFAWNPERWMPDENGKVDQNANRNFWSFSSGSRMCIGMHLAMIVSKVLLSSVYSRCTTSIVDDDGMEQTEDVLALPKSNCLLLRFHSVE